MDQGGLAPPAAEFKDRRVGLIVFGVLVGLLGFACLLLVPLIFASQALSGAATGDEPYYRLVAPSALFYAGIGIANIWLGIGSTMARRWARALLLIEAWGWLLVGVVAGVVTAFVLPQTLANLPDGQSIPGGARIVIVAVMLGFMGVLLALPGTLVLFYRSPHVKATCETRDPVTRWTDGCPLPVLALSLLVGLGAVSVLPVLLHHSVIPFFGHVLSGASGTLVVLALAVVWGWCARATYRLERVGWWTVLISYAAMTASALVTFAQVDLMDMYREMGYPESLIEQLQQNRFVTGRSMMWLVSFWIVPLGGYLLYVKKYFRVPPPVLIPGER